MMYTSLPTIRQLSSSRRAEHFAGQRVQRGQEHDHV